MKTVIEMAREAGGRAQQNKNCDVEYLLSAESIERLVELARADERETLAKHYEDQPYVEHFGDSIADYIRARGETSIRSNT